MTATSHPVISPKKLIEVALPLDAINEECLRRKRKAPSGYPTAFHKWWAQRPVAAARAVLFAQLVNDPEDLWRCQHPQAVPSPQVKGHWAKSRKRLFAILERLIRWESTRDEAALRAASDAISESWRQVCELNQHHPNAAEMFRPEQMPAVLDPFAGGGTIPLEATRLGLQAHGNDLNPVAVLINKAMIEIPSRFAAHGPVCPDTQASVRLIAGQVTGLSGIADDVRRYGAWIAAEAERRIGDFYPDAVVSSALAQEREDLRGCAGKRFKTVAWLWARTVKSPSPAFADVDVPLVSSFVLSHKDDESSFIVPKLHASGYQLEVKVGKPKPESRAGTSFGKQKGFKCIMSGAPISFEYIRTEARHGRMGTKLIAIVAESGRGRLYLPPTHEHESIAKRAAPAWRPDLPIPDQALGFRIQLYGMRTFGDLFTHRQALALTTFSDLIQEVRQRVLADATAHGLDASDVRLESGGRGAAAYADAVCTYLWCVLSRVLHYSSVNCQWLPKDSSLARTFTKQALPMVWDFAEGSPFAKCSAQFLQCLHVVSECIEYLPTQAQSRASQGSALSITTETPVFVSTDPPYYDNIGYADLSDFFYVWLRRTLRPMFPKLLSTMAVPKSEELVATPFRHGDAERAEAFFLAGMTEAMRHLCAAAHPSAPVTIYYAFKQSDTTEDETANTGWETFLEAVLRSGLAITGTWPMRTEGDNRQVGLGTNSLASSIVLVCRARHPGAGTISRRQFVRMLNETLPAALDTMTRADEGEHSPVAPVDLSQAIIGPGMAIFSRYDAVLEADGSPMSVKTALQLINRFLAEDDFDADTQFCLSWFEQHGWDVGKFGEADTLARAKGTSVDGVKQAGVAEAGGGSVRLFRWKEYAADWDPSSDVRLPVWEALHQLIRAYNTKGDAGAAKVLAQTASKAEAMRQLAYRLYTVCERKGRADDARAYNEVVTGWTGIETAASKESATVQGQLFEN